MRSLHTRVVDAMEGVKHQLSNRTGTSGRKTPVETSPRSGTPLTSLETICRLSEDCMEGTERHKGCAKARVEKLTGCALTTAAKECSQQPKLIGWVERDQERLQTKFQDDRANRAEVAARKVTGADPRRRRPLERAAAAKLGEELA